MGLPAEKVCIDLANFELFLISHGGFSQFINKVTPDSDLVLHKNDIRERMMQTDICFLSFKCVTAD